jgi:DNA-binding NtrC family response regulator
MKSQIALIIEDNFFYANLLNERIGKCSNIYPVMANSWSIAKDKLKHNPDIIFLDYNLPDCKGLDIIPYIQQKCPSAKIILMSSQEKLDIAWRSIEMGAYSYLTKNLDDDNSNFFALLDDCMNNSAKENKNTQLIKLLNNPILKNQRI